jgi:hypothetical protein
MARKVSGSGGNGDGKATTKAPAKAPARRRTVKPRPEALDVANDSGGGVDAGDTSAAVAPNSAEVQRRAYELYVERGGRHGKDLDDWYEAERQLREGH